MAGPSYRSNVIVVRKTKLGESDLIVTLLASDGSQLQAVAKGARKPRNPFASRLDIFCVSHVLLAPGKTLDIVQEAALIEPNMQLRTTMERSATAAAAAELLWRITQRDLPLRHLYEASRTGFRAIEEGTISQAPGLSAAMLLKTLAFAGFRPSLERCVVCGASVSDHRGEIWVSAADGGVLCETCRRSVDGVRHPASTVQWAYYLLHNPFSAIRQSNLPLDISFAILHLCQSLIEAHLGMSLKSLEFLFTSGLF